MTTLKKVFLSMALGSSLVACGPLEPEFSKEAQDAKSVVIKVKGGALSDADVFAHFSAKTGECDYIPHLLGLFPQGEPVTPTFYRQLSTSKNEASVTALLPSPLNDRCDWKPTYLAFNLQINGKDVFLIPDPSDADVAKRYLPKGSIKFGCKESPDAGHFICRDDQKMPTGLTLELELNGGTSAPPR